MLRANIVDSENTAHFYPNGRGHLAPTNRFVEKIGV